MKSLQMRNPLKVRLISVLAWRGDTTTIETKLEMRTSHYSELLYKKSRDYHTIGECGDWLKTNT